LNFQLPIEVRLDIYHYALGTDARDTVRYTLILKIGERRVLRRSSRQTRQNRYALLNFNNTHFPVSQSCTQTRLEIQNLLPPPTYQFTSVDTKARENGCGSPDAGLRVGKKKTQTTAAQNGRRSGVVA
jgi:hypothetical protein